MSLIDRAIVVGGSPTPYRTRLFRKLLTVWPIGSFSARLRAGGLERPAYGYCLLNAAREAKALGHKAFTAIEFGVAGGTGLLLLCKYRDQIEAEAGIKINLIGLDAGSGLPQSSDPRDLLYCWPTGSFEMDIPKLRARLAGRAELILGDVSTTARELSIPADAPLGAIMFDLDYYSSTRDAFAIFGQTNILPRVWCYLDDVTGDPGNAYSDSIGVRAAVKDFNDQAPASQRHLSPVYSFKNTSPEDWHQRIFVFHGMSHPDYNRCLSDHKHTLDLA